MFSNELKIHFYNFMDRIQCASIPLNNFYWTWDQRQINLVCFEIRTIVYGILLELPDYYLIFCHVIFYHLLILKESHSAWRNQQMGNSIKTVSFSQTIVHNSCSTSSRQRHAKKKYFKKIIQQAKNVFTHDFDVNETRKTIEEKHDKTLECSNVYF